MSSTPNARSSASRSCHAAHRRCGRGAHRRLALPDHRAPRARRRRDHEHVRTMTTENKGVPMTMRITPERIVDEEASLVSAHDRDLDTRERLNRSGVDVDAVIDEVVRFSVAAPSWAVGTGGTRFGRFPIGGDRAPPRRTSTTSRARHGNRREPDRQPARAVGRPRRSGRAPPAHGGRRGRVRRDELQHVPGQPGDHRSRRDLVQVRIDAHTDPDVRNRARTQPSRHRARRTARSDRDHGVAGRRH